MGLRQIIQSAIDLARLPAGKLLLVVLLSSNGIQFLTKKSSDSIYEKKINKLDDDKDKCAEEKLKIQKENADKLDSVRVQSAKEVTEILKSYNIKVEEALKEQKEANKIQRSTLYTIRKK